MHLAQNAQIIPISVPLDITAGAMTGDWVNMTNFNHCTLIYCGDIGFAGEDATLTVLQGTSNSGGGSKALNFTEVYQKQGATAINAVGVFTKITGQTDNTYVDAAGGENEELIVIEIDAAQMDVAGGYTHISMTIADVGINASAKLACVLAILTEPRYGQEVLASAID